MLYYASIAEQSAKSVSVALDLILVRHQQKTLQKRPPTKEQRTIYVIKQKLTCVYATIHHNSSIAAEYIWEKMEISRLPYYRKSV